MGTASSAAPRDLRDTGSPIRAEGSWLFDEEAGDTAADSSGNGRHLTGVDPAAWTAGGRFGGAIRIGGTAAGPVTAHPPLRTDAGFSVSAWLRLDGAALGGRLRMPEGEHAWTAVSQNGPSHSPFYLGVRRFPEAVPGGGTGSVLRWCFTSAPVDGSVTGLLEWQHARSATPLTEADLDRWVLLVAAFDVAGRRTRLYLPERREQGEAQLPAEWTYWQAGGGLQIGHGRYLDHPADLWPGSVGPVHAFSGVLTAQDAAQLAATGAPARR
ncbi:LamG-like jellyroll fold domain-containing protein [Streptomyces hoynatensis]|nr:LamG-like jellyroll fold domain-containing protein [Streptomyces hoynatensis]